MQRTSCTADWIANKQKKTCFAYLLSGLLLLLFSLQSVAAPPKSAASPRYAEADSPEFNQPEPVAFLVDWNSILKMASASDKLVVLLVEQSDCQYCEIVNRSFLRHLAISPRYQDDVIFKRVSLDAGNSIVDPDGTSITTADFGAAYAASFTPTIIFVDVDGTKLADNLVGFSGHDYYGYYLEEAIELALVQLRWSKLDTKINSSDKSPQAELGPA